MQQVVHLPAARSWREIPQAVKPRAMSTSGRWRLTGMVLRAVAVAAVVGGCGWGVWTMMRALQQDPAKIPETAKSIPVKPPRLKTMRDGVLDDAWLARTLELRPGISLLELKVDTLKARMLADRQVLTAEVEKIFPDIVEARITERMPVARVRVDIDGVQRDLLVARDGVIFFGAGFEAEMLKTLPWLDGLALQRDGIGFAPVADMDVVARLLAEAQFSAPHLYHEWQSVSLARLEADRELEVTLKSGTKALFSAKLGFFVQLANFDHVIDRLSRLPGAKARVDLTLGREVPVTIEPAVAASGDASNLSASTAAPAFHLRPRF